MATYKSLEMTPPEYPVSGPAVAGRGLQTMRGQFAIGTQSTGALSAGDTIQVFRLHRNFLVKGASIKWDALGASVTLALGDATNATRYMAATSASSAGSSNAIADTGRDYLNTVHKNVVILTIAGATTNATGNIVVSMDGVIEQPA